MLSYEAELVGHTQFTTEVHVAAMHHDKLTLLGAEPRYRRYSNTMTAFVNQNDDGDMYQRDGEKARRTGDSVLRKTYIHFNGK